MKPRILVVEDDARTAASIALYLRHAGYDVVMAATGTEAIRLAAGAPPALIVLDLMLPGIDGLEVCRAVRDQIDAAIIILTARTTEADKLQGLAAGADDYVTKPFSPRELVARVAAVLRRTRPATGVITAGDLRIDLSRRHVRRANTTIALTPTEYRLLEVLASAPGRAFTRAELAERALGHDFDGFERTVDAHVMNLRRKLDPFRVGRQPVVATVFGVGYRFDRDDRDQ
jgi:two-component system alkaline phosphatase synthesis response regulator PhoP